MRFFAVSANAPPPPPPLTSLSSAAVDGGSRGTTTNVVALSTKSFYMPLRAYMASRVRVTPNPVSRRTQNTKDRQKTKQKNKHDATLFVLVSTHQVYRCVVDPACFSQYHIKRKRATQECAGGRLDREFYTRHETYSLHMALPRRSSIIHGRRRRSTRNLRRFFSPPLLARTILLPPLFQSSRFLI